MTLLKGNCLETLKTLETASVDSIVTDPPYELGFMGKSWDNSGIAYNQDLWAECLRVLKPGGHLLAFSGSRTYHRMVVAIEDSGFEIRDQIMWIYGSGFPKSLDVSKAIDKTAGAKREVVGSRPLTGNGKTMRSGFHQPDGTGAGETEKQDVLEFTAPATPEAQQWQGWGTALKPAHEPIVVARKPLIGTVANNVLTYGTGALNIDGSRVGTEIRHNPSNSNDGTTAVRWTQGRETQGRETQGRWPANVIHDGSDEVLELFPDSKGGAYPAKRGQAINTAFASGQETEGGFRAMGDSGSAARFFKSAPIDEADTQSFIYCAKASKSERNAGLESNFHPTVKPLALMRYLVKLVTPPNGIVLDPFLGSGTTAVSAILEGFEWIGCEMTEDYFPIIEARVAWAQNERKTEKATPTLFERGEKL